MRYEIESLDIDFDLYDYDTEGACDGSIEYNDDLSKFELYEDAVMLGRQAKSTDTIWAVHADGEHTYFFICRSSNKKNALKEVKARLMKFPKKEDE